MAILNRQLLGPSAITRRMGHADARQDGSPSWSGGRMYLQSAVTVVPEDGSGSITLPAFTEATVYTGETIDRNASHFVSFIDKATYTLSLCQQEHWAAISGTIDVYPLWYHTARNSVPYQPRGPVIPPVPVGLVLGLYAAGLGVTDTVGDFSISAISAEQAQTTLPTAMDSRPTLAIGNNGSYIFDGYLTSDGTISTAIIVLFVDGITNPDPTTYTIVNTMRGIAHWGGTWRALVLSQQKAIIGGAISSTAWTVQKSTTANPVLAANWTIERTLYGPSGGTAPLYYGIGAGGSVLHATTLGSGWSIVSDTGTVTSLGTTVIDYGNIHAYDASAGLDAYTPNERLLPFRWNGPPGSPMLVGHVVIWQTGHTDVGYMACCGDGVGGAYAVTLSGDVIHWASPGASPTTIVSGACPGMTVSWNHYTGYTYTGETVLLFQPDRHDSGKLDLYHGNSNTVTPTTVDVTAHTASSGSTFAWYTDSYHAFEMIVHVDDPFVTWTGAYTEAAAR